MKILVTGGAGFIGSHIVKLLCDSGHAVTIFDNLSLGHKDAVDGRACLVVDDLKSKPAIRKALRGQEAVIHMAGSTEVGESVKFPQHFFDNNLHCGMNLLEAMRNTDVKKIIFSSTAAVYGEPCYLPMDEEHPKFPTNPYGATKLAFESLLSAYHRCFGFDVAILRYFNAYGPGELHQPETHAIPNFIAAILGKKPVPLYWKGNQKRDFVYVTDIAQAHIKPLTLSGFHYFNVGTQSGITMIDLLERIAKIIGRKSDIQDLGDRLGDPQELMASNEKIRKQLGWKPDVDLDEGLKKTIAWFRDR